MLGLSLAYLMWWCYFGGDDTRAEHALAGTPMERRARVAIAAYGWAHYFLLLGIVVVAAGVKKTVGHAVEHLTPGPALALGGGLAIYLLGDCWFRRILRLGPIRFRATAAVLAVATVPLGLFLAAYQMVALTILLAAMLAIEARGPQPVVAEI